MTKHGVWLKRHTHYNLYMDMSQPIGQRRMEDRLKRPIEQWLAEHNINWSLQHEWRMDQDVVEDQQLAILFDSPQHAILFKLVWY